jgi:hypothetical protein
MGECFAAHDPSPISDVRAAQLICSYLSGTITNNENHGMFDDEILLVTTILRRIQDPEKDKFQDDLERLKRTVKFTEDEYLKAHGGSWGKCKYQDQVENLTQKIRELEFATGEPHQHICSLCGLIFACPGREDCPENPKFVVYADARGEVPNSGHFRAKVNIKLCDDCGGALLENAYKASKEQE